MSLLLVAAAAASFADLDAIDRQVAGFAGAAVGEAGGALSPVDRRLRLQPCLAGLALSWRTPSQDSVVVQCGDAGGWRLFVPVRREQAVAARGENAVTRGDALAIAVTGDGFTVSQPGEALASGPVGAWIAVQPLSQTGKRGADKLRARIVRPGLVTITIP